MAESLGSAATNAGQSYKNAEQCPEYVELSDRVFAIVGVTSTKITVPVNAKKLWVCQAANQSFISPGDRSATGTNDMPTALGAATEQTTGVANAMLLDVAKINNTIVLKTEATQIWTVTGLAAGSKLLYWFTK